MDIPGANVNIEVVDALYYFTTAEGIERLDRFPRGRRVPGPEADQMITNVLSGKKGSAYVISLKNGNFLLLGEDGLVFTQEGWKKVQELSSEDHIYQGLTSPRYFNNAGKSIPYKNEIRGGSLPIFIPEKLNYNFAKWLGLYLSCGFIDEQKDWIGIRTHNEATIDAYKKLSKEVFTITPEEKSDKREGRKKNFVFSSVNLINFIRLFVGIKRTFRKIPSFLLEASLEEQVEFIKGFQFESEIKGKDLVFYRDVSKPIADFMVMVFRNCGYVAKVNQIKAKSKSESDLFTENEISVYEVRVQGLAKENLKIQLDDPEKDKVLNQYSSCLVLWEDFLNHQPKSYHPNYSAWRNLKNRRHKLISLDIVKSIYPDFPVDGYFVGLKNLKAMEKDLISIKLLSTKGMFINGFLIAGS